MQHVLPAAQLFSSMPPLELLKIFVSVFTSRVKSKNGGSYKLRHYDISRAHFMGKAQRTVYIELPESEQARLDTDKIGLLKKSMYGAQDASHIWQLDYLELFEAAGFVRGSIAEHPCILRAA